MSTIESTWFTVSRRRSQFLSSNISICSTASVKSACGLNCRKLWPVIFAASEGRVGSVTGVPCGSSVPPPLGHPACSTMAHTEMLRWAEMPMGIALKCVNTFMLLFSVQLNFHLYGECGTELAFCRENVVIRYVQSRPQRIVVCNCLHMNWMVEKPIRLSHSGSWLVLPHHPQWASEGESLCKDSHVVCSRAGLGLQLLETLEFVFLTLVPTS